LYNFRNYTVKDGVAQSQVYSLLQDSRGYIWMGTRGGGITQFDGVHFKTFSVKDGLANNNIFKIVEDHKKNLWIATNNGITSYNGKEFKNYSKTFSSFQLSVHDLKIDKNDRKWLATNNGVYIFEKGKFKNISGILKIKKSLINTLFIDKKDRIWFGTENGLYQIIEKNNIYFLKDYSKISRYMRNSITSINEDKSGNLWIGTYGDGAYKFDQKSFERFDFNQELYKQTILDIYTDRQNNVYFATLKKGVSQYNNSTKIFSWLSENEGLSNNHVRSIIQDNSGSFWFGTSGGGVCNYFGKKFTTYDKSSGLGGNFIYSIYRDSQEKLWIGNSQNGVSTYDVFGFTNYNAKNGFQDVKVKAICEDNNGIIYLGTDGDGVFTFDGIEFKSLVGLDKKYIRSIKKDENGNLWFATAGNGLYLLKVTGTSSEISNFSTNDGLLNNRLTTLYIDKKGRIWYGTENHGIGYIFNEKVNEKTITTQDGLVANSIRSLVEDNNGYLWIGTGGSGISSFNLYDNKQEIKNYDHANGLSSSNIYLLTIDRKNNLISGTETGLDYISFNENRKIKTIKHYSKGDGFTGIEACQNAVYNDKDGTIWFGTINGLSKYNPANSTKNKYAPIINVTDVKLFYESISKTKYHDFMHDWNQVYSLELPYSQNHLSFNFNAVNLSNPDGIKYKWKLAGFDEEWSPSSKENSIVYSYLFPGEYKFMVKSCNEDGVWNKYPVQVKVRIATPFWLQLWVIVLVLVGLLVIIIVLFKWRINRIKFKSAAEKRKLQMEKELVELEQKTLRLQMNPHFIFNALNSIQSLIGTGKEQEARYYLAKFSRLMRQILDNSRNPFISLEEEASSLENYLMIEKFCNGDRFDYQITVSEDIEQDFIKIPPMLLQPFIENAIKHGLKFTELDQIRRGFINIEFVEENNILICSISDNGVGRAKAEELNHVSKEKYHTSTALIVIQERLELLKENYDIQTLEIIDLYDENQNALGTKVIVRIPI
jgi:ligand-binding sensor domain-containing protein